MKGSLIKVGTNIAHVTLISIPVHTVDTALSQVHRWYVHVRNMCTTAIHSVATQTMLLCGYGHMYMYM